MRLPPEPLWAEPHPCTLTPLQLATVVAMVGVTYAAVPLYRMFCQVGGDEGMDTLAGLPQQHWLPAGVPPAALLLLSQTSPPHSLTAQATGYGGTVQEGRAVEDKIRRREENPDAAVEAAAAAREVTVFFDCSVAGGWGLMLGQGGMPAASLECSIVAIWAAFASFQPSPPNPHAPPACRRHALALPAHAAQRAPAPGPIHPRLLHRAQQERQSHHGWVGMAGGWDRCGRADD